MDNQTAFLQILVALNVMLPIAAVLGHCGVKRIQIDHVAAFSLGYLFYWILPVAAGLAGVFADPGNPVMSAWYSLFYTISNSTLEWFLILSLVCYFAFLSGTWLGSRTHSMSPLRLGAPAFDRRLLIPLLWLSAICLAALSFALRDQLFTGYATGMDPWIPDPLRSALGALSTILIILLLLDCAAKDRGDRSAGAFRRLLAGRFFLLYLLASLLDVSVGARMYMVSGILMLCVYRSVFFRRFAAVNLVCLVGIGLLLAGLVGVWRMGRADYGIFENLASEPMFTAMSLIHFLGSERLPLLRYPVLLLSEFLNLVPTFLFPGKMELFLQPEDIGYVTFSPGGGLNSFFSFMINFGVLGTIGVLFGLGFAMAVLKKGAGSPLLRVIYIMISGWLGFSFFRDPFYVSIVKCMVEFSVVVPTLIVVSLHLCTQLMARRGARDGGAIEVAKVTA
jgi:hypothetical protein